MIRFAWRQFRVPFLIAVGGLAIVAIVLGITGLDLSHLYNTTVANCQSQGDCQSAISTLDGYDHFLQVIVQALPLVVPALIGMFWGAPLAARELESGTFRLAWTQGRSRWQWLVGKVAVVGLSSVVVMGLLSLMTTWWWNPISRANPNRFSPGLFSIFGLTPVGYAAFAFAFGLMAGVIMRRTLAAMATTLVAFIGARIVVNFWVRPHFAPPARLVMALNTSSNRVGINKSPSGLNIDVGAPALPNAWVTSTELVNKAGQQPSGGLLQRICPQVVNAIIRASQASPIVVRPPAAFRTRSTPASQRSVSPTTSSSYTNQRAVTDRSSSPKLGCSSPQRLSRSRSPTGGSDAD